MSLILLWTFTVWFTLQSMGQSQASWFSSKYLKAFQVWNDMRGKWIMTQFSFWVGVTLLSVVMDYWLVLARINYLKIKHLNDGLFTCTHKHTHCFSLHRCPLMDWSHVDYLWIIVDHLICWRSVGEQVMPISSNLLQLRNTPLHLGWPGVSTFQLLFCLIWGTCFNGIVDFTWYSNCYSHYQIKLFPP